MSLASWLRRRRKWGVAAVIVLTVYALFGFFAVPWILRGQIRKQALAHLKREATVERVRFNPFTLAATVEGFRLADRDGGDLLAVDRLRVDLQSRGIFRRAWRFREVLVEGPVATVRILADGNPSVADLMESDPVSPEPEAAFRMPRLIVDRLAVTAGRVEFSDNARQPAFVRGFAPLNLEVRDLITIPEESGEHSFTIGMGEGAELRWTGRQTVEPLHFTGQVDITGVDLRTVWEYFGRDQFLDVAEGRAGVMLPYDLQRGPEGVFSLSVEGASFDVRNLVVRPRVGPEDWLTVSELRGRNVDAAWPAARIEIGGIRVSQPHALVRLDEEGRLNWAGLGASATPDEPAGTPRSSFELRVDRVEIEGGSMHFEDRSTEPDVAADLSDMGLQVEGLSTDLRAKVAFQASVHVAAAGALHVSGSVVPDPLEAEVEVDLAGLDVLPFRPYVETPGVRLSSAVVGLRGQGRLSGALPSISFAGGGAIDALEIHDSRGERLLGCEHIGIEGVKLEHPHSSARIQKVIFDRAYANVQIDREGTLNLATLTATAPEGTAQPVEDGESARVEIGTVAFRDASIDFADQSLILPFGTKIHSANGALHDLSTFAAAAATLTLEGRVAETGHVKVNGSVRLADPFASTDLEVLFRGLEMPTLTPYAATFAGYSIEHGVLDLDVHYRVVDRRMLGDHRVVASDLRLGKKVEGASSGAGLAVRLAIALLKDKNGRIDLEVPVEGTVDSPEFAYRKVLWQAVRTILGNIGKAPFRALGRLFGRDEEDLELVEFDPGRSDLLPAEQDKLSKLAEEIGPRSELTLEAEGRFDPLSDTAALRRSKLDGLIESRRAATAAIAAESEASTLEVILEALFVERFSAEALATARLSFMPAPPESAPIEEPAETPKKHRKKGAEAPPPPPIPPGTFDAAGFYEALRSQLLEAQTVTDAELIELGAARSAAIIAALTDSRTLESSRVKALVPVPVKRKKAGSERIASEMTLTARRGSEDGGADE